LTEVSTRPKCSPCSSNYPRSWVWESKTVHYCRRQPGTTGYGGALLADMVRYKGTPAPPTSQQNPKRKAKCSANNISAFSLRDVSIFIL